MSKKSREAILSNLSRVLDPPAPPRRRGANLDGLLNEYSPPEQEKAQPPSPALAPTPVVAESPVTETSNVTETRHITETSHTPETSHVSGAPDAVSETWHAPETSHVLPASHVSENTQTLAALAETLKYGEGHARINHDFFDSVVARLPSDAQLLWVHLNRYREGRANYTVQLNWPKLEQKTKLSRSTLYRVSKVLKREGLAEQFGLDLGRGKEQGFRFRLFYPTSLVTQTSHVRETRHITETHNKRKDLKENSKKGINRLTPDEIQSFTATVADLLGEGQSIEEIEGRFAPTMHVVDWATVRSTALAQAAPKRGK
ncbi:MAG TPA: hypothetical protein VF297_32460 [Pyrinomonadaceae bacterium]